MLAGEAETPEGLMWVIAKGKILNARRATKRRAESFYGLLEDLEQDQDLQLQYAIPPTVERNWFVQQFDSALRSLPDDEFDAYVLTEIRGLSDEEAGVVLETSYKTVNRRAERARQILQEEIA